MIPNTLLGLLVLAASIGPGYVFVRVAELRNPRPSRSALLELAELVSVGGAASAIGLFLVLIVLRFTEWVGAEWVDVNALAREGTTYALEHPARGLLFLLAVIGTAYGLAYISAKWWYRDFPASLRNHSTWHELLDDENGSRRIYAFIELRDGRQVKGYVHYYTVEQAPAADREIVLGTPVQIKAKWQADWQPLAADVAAIGGQEIVALSVRYFSNEPESSTQKTDKT